MARQTILSRKSFLRLLTGLGAGTFFWTWYRISDNKVEKEKQLVFSHREDIPAGVSHFGKYYLYRNAESVIAFSTICTHAGCRIGKSNSGILQCGCHGSRFDAATGMPVKGPAIRPLQKLECRLETRSGEWIVKLESPERTHA